MISFLWKSFYDARAYNSAIQTWKFKALLYFVLVSFVSSIFASALSVPAFIGILDAEAAHFSSQIPECEIGEKGFAFPHEKPVFVKLKDGRNFIAFTSDFLDPQDMDGVFAAFEKSWITFKTGADAEKRMPYSEIWQWYSSVYPSEKSIKINPENAAKFLGYLKKYSIFAMPIFNFFMAMLSNAAIIVSVLIPAHLLAARMLKNPTIFGSIKMSALASTPAILLSSAGLVFGMSNFAVMVFALLSFALVWKMTRKVAVLQIIEGSGK